MTARSLAMVLEAGRPGSRHRQRGRRADLGTGNPAVSTCGCPLAAQRQPHRIGRPRDEGPESSAGPRRARAVRPSPLQNGGQTEGNEPCTRRQKPCVAITYGVSASEAPEARRLVELRDRSRDRTCSMDAADGRLGRVSGQTTLSGGLATPLTRRRHSATRHQSTRGDCWHCDWHGQGRCRVVQVVHGQRGLQALDDRPGV